MNDLNTLDLTITSNSRMADAVVAFVGGPMATSTYNQMVGMPADDLATFCDWLRRFDRAGGCPWRAFQPQDFWSTRDASALTAVGCPPANPMQVPSCLYGDE